MRNRARRTQISQNEPNLAVRRTQISWNEPTLRPRRSQIATNEPSRRAAPNCANEPNGVGHELRERTQTRNARADYSGFADQSIGVWPASSTNEPNAVVLHREMRERTQSRGIVPAKCANEPKIVGQTRRTKPGSPAGRARNRSNEPNAGGIRVESGTRRVSIWARFAFPAQLPGGQGSAVEPSNLRVLRAVIVNREPGSSDHFPGNEREWDSSRSWDRS